MEKEYRQQTVVNRTETIIKNKWLNKLLAQNITEKLPKQQTQNLNQNFDWQTRKIHNSCRHKHNSKTAER